MILLIPSVSYIASDDLNIEDFPTLFDENGSINDTFSDDIEDFFGDNLPIKNYIVTAENFIKSTVFKSESSNVVTGSDDYLFYSETNDDYLKTHTLNDRETYSVCKTISLLEEYCDDNNVNFIFTAVPNKNTVLSDKMPYNFIPTDNKSNLELIKSGLAGQGVNYVDLTDYLTEELYLKKDSHWDNRGAYTAFNEIIKSTSNYSAKESISSLIDDNPFYEVTRTNGDLSTMLFPSIDVDDTQYYTDAFDIIAENINIRITGAKTRNSQELMNTIIDNPDENYSRISTTSDFDFSNGNLFMLRDSFCRAMFPYFASSFESSVFVKSCSYDSYIYPIEDYSDFIFEIVERNLPEILESEQRIPTPVRDNVSINGDISDNKSNNVTINCSDEYSDYIYVEGTIDSTLLDYDSNIYVAVTDSNNTLTTYEAFPGEYDESTNSYRYYLTLDNLDSDNYTFKVIVDNTIVLTNDITF